MAKPLSELQSKINKDLKKLNPNSEAFTSADFEKKIIPKTLEFMYSDTYLQIDDGKIYGDQHNQRIVDRTKLMLKIAEQKDWNTHLPLDLTNIDIYNATASFFGLSRIALIKRIMHQDYVFANMEDSDNTYVYLWKNKRDAWVHFCNQIDQFITYIQMQFPNWDTMKKSDKNEYIQSIENLQDAPFISDKRPIIYFTHFLKHYGLNQKNKAKAEYLLMLKMPNINTFEVAKEITEYTNLKFFSTTK